MLAGFSCLTLPPNAPCYQNFTISAMFASSLKVLDMSANSLSYVRTHLLTKNITILRLSYNIIKLRKNDFENAPPPPPPPPAFLNPTSTPSPLQIALPFGRSYCFVGKQILEIPEGIFDQLLKLQVLNLENNAIQFLPASLFKFNKNLRYLDLSLSALGLQVIDPTFLKGLYSLQYLDLSSSALCHNETDLSVNTLTLSEVYGNLTSLQYLMLGLAPSTIYQQLDIRIYYDIKVSKIDQNAFRNLTGSHHINIISIAKMSIKTIEKNSFSKL